ncbi:hypothetical protein [Lysobacter sp. ESA13C]|uniref:hypothetical protein n=1 Tax=Lysobacter sp. ESA13C TaxID=2862676 RepID=UPI001CBCB276|nr:hypothetical protein [Lysobacter sp. ESA13C]
MIARNELEIYLVNVTQTFSATEAHAILMRFMCRCLLLAHEFLPEIGRNALNLATAFWLSGEGQAEDLLTARIACWNYLDSKHRSTDIQDREDAAMRAVICVLYAEPESDDFSVETVHWFADMFDRLGDYSNETAQLMKD